MLVFCWSRMCHSRAVKGCQCCRTRPRLMQRRGAVAGAGLSALITSLLLLLELVQFHLLGVFPIQHSRSCSHSFCTHLIKKFSLASGTLVNQQRPTGQKAHGSWDCFHVRSSNSYTVALCFSPQRQLRSQEAFGCACDPCTHL